MVSSASSPFQVMISDAIAEAIRQLQRQTSREGRGPGVLQAVRMVDARLPNEPTEFGEPLYRLPALRLQVRCAAVGPLYVDFGVCEDRSLVFIKSVKLLPAPESV
jgi:hypothetical protein